MEWLRPWISTENRLEACVMALLDGRICLNGLALTQPTASLLLLEIR